MLSPNLKGSVSASSLPCKITLIGYLLYFPASRRRMVSAAVGLSASCFFFKNDEDFQDGGGEDKALLS